MHSRYARNLYDPKIKRIFEIAQALFEIILFIHFYPLKQALGQSQKQFMKKIYDGLLFTISNEYVWPKFFLIFMHGLKSAILAIFQKDWYGTF